MTDMEKKVMVRLCAKILTETELYEMDMEVRNLIDWICVSEQIKENNNTIRKAGDFVEVCRDMNIICTLPEYTNYYSEMCVSMMKHRNGSCRSQEHLQVRRCFGIRWYCHL